MPGLRKQLVWPSVIWFTLIHCLVDWEYDYCDYSAIAFVVTVINAVHLHHHWWVEAIAGITVRVAIHFFLKSLGYDH